MKRHRVFLALAAFGLAVGGCGEQDPTHEQPPTEQAPSKSERSAKLKASGEDGATVTVTVTTTVTVTDTATATATGIVTVTNSSTATATQTATASATATQTRTITQTATSTHTFTGTQTAAGTTATKTATAQYLNVTGTRVGTVTMRNDYVPAKSYVWTATLTRAETAPTTFNGSATATGTYVDSGVTYTGSGTTTSMMQFSSFATSTTTKTVPANYSGALSKTVLGTGTGYGWMGSITWTYTKTATGTHTATVTQTNTVTVTNTPTVTSTATNTVTTTSTVTVTSTGTKTATGTITTSGTATHTETATSTSTHVSTCSAGVTVSYAGSDLPADIAGQYNEAFDCTRDEGGAWFGGVDFSYCFRKSDGSSWRIWNTGCGWEYGRREPLPEGPAQVTVWQRHAKTYAGLCSSIPPDQLTTAALSTTVFYDSFGDPISGLSSSACGIAPPDACTLSYTVGGAPNPDIGAVLTACPDLAGALLWVDAANLDVPYASWASAMKDRLATLYTQMLANGPLTDLACPDPRGADAIRFPTWANMPDGTPMEVYFTLAQATDIFLASVAHALALEVRHTLPWSLRDYPVAELEPLLSARSLFVPVTQPPHPFGGTPIPDVAYQAPMAHDAHGFVCDPRVGYDFIRGTTSKTGQDLVAGSATETLAQLTFFLTQNSVHGFPLDFAEPISTFRFTLGERLHLGLLEPEGTPAPWIIARLGCHSTAENLEELARAVNIPVRNVASYDFAWTDGTSYSFRANTHRGLAYAWTRPAERRILPHADYVDATALWPNYHQPFAALDYFNIVWRTPDSYQSMGLQVDMSMPIVPILPANSKGSFETYFDFGRVLAVLGSDTIGEGRYYLRTDACSWDLAYAYCKDPAGGVAAFQANNPYGGYYQFSDAALLQASYDAIATCIAALPDGCSAVPASYPDFVATNYLP